MKSPADQKIIQIELTNACPHECANCTRFVGHHAKPFFMNRETFVKAVQSLDRYEGMVGIIGGEPTLHPQFAEFVDILSKMRPENGQNASHVGRPITDFSAYRDTYLASLNHRIGLWSSFGNGYRKHFEVIQDAFRYQCLNDHTHSGEHLALMITRKELGIPDSEWEQYREHCWVQNLWSSCITPKGAFFCEVAGALDMLLDGPGGWPIERRWWKRRTDDFKDQLHWCELCCACLPVPRVKASDHRDIVSPEWAERLAKLGSRKIEKHPPHVFDTKRYNRADYRANSGAEPYIPDGDNSVRVSRSTAKCLAVSTLHGLTVCDGYADYLAITLAQNVRNFDRFVVVTGPDDRETPRVCDRYGAECIVCDRLHSDGAPFRKGAAVNDAIRHLGLDEWILILDADVVLPATFREDLEKRVLNPGCIYYTKRWGPELEALPDFVKGIERGTSWHDLYWQFARKDTARFEDRNGNDIEHFPFGYFQLFHPSAHSLRSLTVPREWYPENFRTAEYADMLFGQKYPPAKQVTLNQDQDGNPIHAFDVIHLPHGNYKQNWEGRTSPRIDEKKSPPSFGVALAAYNLPGELEQFVKLNAERIRAAGGAIFVAVADRENTPSNIEKIRVPEQSVYSPARTANMAIRSAAEAGCRVVVKTDVDCILSPAFIEILKTMKDGQGYCPYYQYVDDPARLEDAKTDQASCGTLALTARAWNQIHGYDERMLGYGREDGDAADRACKVGIKIVRTTGLVYHINHPSRISKKYPLLRDENIALSKQENYDCADWGKGEWEQVENIQIQKRRGMPRKKK